MPAGIAGVAGRSPVSDYQLHYWPVPFRGQFVRAVLAFAGRTWAEADPEAISRSMDGPAPDMPVPFKGPPVLIDQAANFAVSQMPAIVLYLGETLDLLPPSPALRALTIKVVCDANDVLDEVTLHGGREMWTADSWKAFEPRLATWMELWEELGRRHGLTEDAGLVLGGEEPGVADVVTSTLWATMAERFPRIGAMLREKAPRTAALAGRIAARPALAALAARSRRDWGDAWCGGQIEASLRKALG